MKNVPNLRFKEFSAEWENYRLKDVSQIYDGTHQTPKYKSSGIKFISVENIKDIYSTDKFISEEDYQKNFKIRPQINDIFMTRITAGEIGATAIVTQQENLAYYVSLALIRGDQTQISSMFLNYYIASQYFKNELHKRIIHVAFPKKINLGDIGECLIKKSKLEEQEKIASFFSLIDKKIELQTEKVEELKNYKKGIMQKIFSQELRFKDENGNDYPEWEKRKLQDVVERKIKGKNPVYSEIGNVLLNNEFMENNTHPLFVENEIDVTKKDILILWDGSQAGKVYTGFEGVLGSTFVAITLNQNNCNIFMQEQLEYNLDKIQRAWREGSGVPHVAKDFIENYKVFVPCYEEQNKVSKVLLNINEKINLENKKLQYTKELKKGLLQQMFI